MEAGSPGHVAAVVATALGAALLVALVRRGDDAVHVVVRRALALVILGAYACEQLTYVLRDRWSVELNLPLHLTDAVTLASVAALWRPGCALLVELVFFWAFAASLQAVLTPDLGERFPDVLAFTYFLTHSGAIAAAALLVLGERRTPRPGAVPRIYAITLGFTGVAAAGTVLTGGNYMYLRRKPANGSLLDLMGPWPVYIGVAAVLGVAILALLAAAARRLAPPRQAQLIGS